MSNSMKRKEIIKNLIERLHNGEDEEVTKKEFKKNFANVSGTEIAEAEKLLMEEGVKLEEVQSLCSVHASMFDGIIEIDDQEDYLKTEGHPLYILAMENEAIEKELHTAQKAFEMRDIGTLKTTFNNFKKIDIHYLKKENLIFPILEQHDISGPSKVMWKVDDDIRKLIKETANELHEDIISDNVNMTLSEIEEMIFKENNILVPMLLETFDESEWVAIAKEMDDIGYSLISKDFKPWKSQVKPKEIIRTKHDDEQLVFETGSMSFEAINSILNTLPLDVTFVDKDDRFSYFSNGKERIFTRTKAALGRDVYNCHPSQSVDIVEQIIKDFKSGKKDNESFWIKMGPKFIYIQYFALRDTENNYLGTLEASQDIVPIQAIEGEKRIIDTDKK